MLNIKRITAAILTLPLLAFISVVMFTWSGNAIAAGCEAGACLQVGPRLASLDTQQSALLNPLFSGLLGSNIALDMMDWKALAGGDINLLKYLSILESDLTVSGTDQVLFADASLMQLISAAKNVAQSDGNNDLVTALGLLPLAGLSDTIKLGDLLKIDLQQGTLADTDLNALNLLTGLIQLYNYKNVLTTPAPVALDTSALSPLGLDGIVNGVELYLQIVEPPIYTCGPVGTTFHTAVIRSKLNLDLIDLSPDSSAMVSAITGQLSSLAGLDVTADIKLADIDLYVEVARAEGTLMAIDAIANTVTVQATPGLVDIYLGSIADNLFFNRTHIIDPDVDVLPGVIGTLDLQIKQTLPLSAVAIPLANIQTDILARAAAKGEAPFADLLVFSGPYPQTKTVDSSADFANVLISDLVNDLTISFSSNLGLLDTLVSGLLDTVTSSLTTIVNDALSPILHTVLTQLVDPLLRLLGIGIGEADVTVISAGGRCDFGSCPTSYGEASHGISDNLYLGSAVPDAENSTPADDADDNGVATLPVLTSQDRNYSIDVTATNNTGDTANLIAWIDFDGNGIFDPDEAAMSPVPTGTNNGSVTLTWSNIPQGSQIGDSYLQVRLTTDPISNQQATGSASDGEVESYPISIVSAGVSVSGRVFRDINVNASNDGNDNGEVGVTQLPIVLYDTQTQQCVSTKTNGDGYYQFDKVAAGSYQLYQASKETVPTPKQCGPDFAKNPGGYLSTTDNVRPILNEADSDISGQDFGEIKPPRLTPNNTGQILPGNVVFYAHKFTTPAKGVVTLTSQFSNSVSTGWSSLLYPDSNCDGKLNGTEGAVPMSGSRSNRLIWVSDPVSLEAEGALCFINKVYAPANVAANDRYQQSITSTLDYGNAFAGVQESKVRDLTTATQVQAPALPATPEVEATDATESQPEQAATPTTPYTPATEPTPAQEAVAATPVTPAVGASRLELRKTVQNITQGTSETETINQAAPGNILEYRIYYKNTGTGPITDLSLDDMVPDYTELDASSMSCDVTPLDMICDENIATNQQQLHWHFTGKFAGGLMGYVSYRVTVDH
ncbi:GEVED domain-containing protein [Leucothrix mucor]|uniref:GEVED domain-containing protein n=1 Tax=Leucothrix mucor TaxID=45248 RepID=UPI00040063DF|nr:GEVED domain-containing protein [Leucothrix mucor]